MDHEQDPEQDTLLDWLLPDPLRVIIGWIGLIALFCVGFWQVFVIVADITVASWVTGRPMDPAERARQTQLDADCHRARLIELWRCDRRRQLALERL
jgi:hypothetical protein